MNILNIMQAHWKIQLLVGGGGGGGLGIKEGDGFLRGELMQCTLYTLYIISTIKLKLNFTFYTAQKLVIMVIYKQKSRLYKCIIYLEILIKSQY